LWRWWWSGFRGGAEAVSEKRFAKHILLAVRDGYDCEKSIMPFHFLFCFLFPFSISFFLFYYFFLPLLFSFFSFIFTSFGHPSTLPSPGHLHHRPNHPYPFIVPAGGRSPPAPAAGHHHAAARYTPPSIHPAVG
jgi:hypothetical protein